MRREAGAAGTAQFRREWNAAFGLAAAIAVLLLAAGHRIAGAIAIAIGATAIVARWATMRKQGRKFYGQDKHSS